MLIMVGGPGGTIPYRWWDLEGFHARRRRQDARKHGREQGIDANLAPSSLYEGGKIPSTRGRSFNR